MMKLVRWLAVACVIGGAVVGWRMVTSHAEQPTIPTVTVGEGDLVREVSAEGNLRAVKATPITAPREAGEWGPLKIAWIATDGTRVKKGDPVVKFDRSELEQRLANGRGDLASANAQQSAEQIRSATAVDGRDRDAKLARVELEARKQLEAKDSEIFSRNQIIESEIDDKLSAAKERHAEQTKQVERDLSRSKSNVIGVQQQKAKLEIQHASSALDSMEVHAPHDGLLVIQRNWEGELPKVGDTVWPGHPLAEIPLLDTMEAEVFVLEVEATGLAERQPAAITLESQPSVVYDGKIRLVDKLAKPRVRGQPIQYFAVVVALAKTDAAIMKPGTRVRAKLSIDKSHGIVVPRQAIVTKDGKTYVYKQSAISDFELTAVELGAATTARVIVKGGLAVGDVIALRDPTRSLDQALGSGSDSVVPTAGGGGDDNNNVIIIE